MPEQSPNQAGSEDSSEQFVDLEVQEHFEAISKDLPLYEQYYKELEEMAKSLGTRLTDQQMPPAHERRVSLEANKATIDSEMLAIFETMQSLKKELAAISEQENRVHDFINDWRNKIGIRPEAQATEPPEGVNPSEAGEGVDSV